MSDDPKQLDKTKIIGFKVTEDELRNLINPVMHDCYQLGPKTTIESLRSYASASTFGLGTTA
jgi:hypothetical protein